jgi:serine/threonine protein kinase
MRGNKMYKVEKGKAILNGIPVKLDNITFFDILEKGANGIVFKGFDNLLNRDVAVKFWIINKKSRKDKMKQAIAESSKIANLRHPRIVTVFSAGQIDDSIFYVVMEFLPGETLNNFLKNRKPDILTRLKLWEDIAEAMKYAHGQEVYHGDLHQGNVIVFEGRAKVIDFGTSIFVREHENSLKRESRLILNIAKKIFPKFNLLGIDKLNIKDLTPEAMLSACETLVNINHYYLPQLRHRIKQKDSFGIRQQLHHIKYDIYYCPLFKTEYIVECLRKNSLNEDYINYFLDFLKRNLIAEIEGKSEYRMELNLEESEESVDIKLINIKPIFMKAMHLFLSGQWRP